ncbi:MAG: PGPGW domain-containing protein [Planctomycetes bacterium]|nr:PGPGW domain-containing protein [Planctomycetota bacterium]
MEPVDEPPAVVYSPPPTAVNSMLRPIRQLIIFVLGISVLVVGVAMIVLPGPAMVVIPAGLAILATEFVWAKRWLNYLKRRAQEVANWTLNSGAAKESGSSVEAGTHRDQA